MKQLKPLILFQKRIVPPALLISIALGILLFREPWGIGLVFLVVAPVLHYYTYEIRSENEYVFYYNLGFSRLALWMATFGIGLVLTVLSFLL
ncbi:hypothetical protein [Robiginitalea aurantiaca]|uniref:1,4-dihydroxy-2-naphthoate octaprenyltransferase n=1 Tax=Robiginitalea aurantiaca TaxID=3056915 RepID=A0ABT7WFR8_9FLAO|nr:hypothetical protein [Robiginitalea aurantiaca]MDM9631762.1 hypothetical protein [Robiginitalea aurantiaca]